MPRHGIILWRRRPQHADGLRLQLAPIRQDDRVLPATVGAATLAAALAAALATSSTTAIAAASLAIAASAALGPSSSVIAASYMPTWVVAVRHRFEATLWL